MGEHDDHLLDAVCLGEVRRFAVAIDPTAVDLNERQAMMRRKLDERLGRNRFELTFFDRGSSGCWIAA
jgi:hypothetical protein